MKTVIKNIAELIQTESKVRKWVSGNDMKSISTIKDAFIEIINNLEKSLSPEMKKLQTNLLDDE